MVKIIKLPISQKRAYEIEFDTLGFRHNGDNKGVRTAFSNILSSFMMYFNEIKSMRARKLRV